MDGFWDWFWLMVWWFFFIAYLVVLFQIVADLFRDKALSGWWKALWIIALIFVPYLSALVYVIARGRGMAERHAEEDRARRQVMDDYVRAKPSAIWATCVASAKPSRYSVIPQPYHAPVPRR